MERMKLEIYHTISQGITIVTLIGRLDTDSTEAFEESNKTLTPGPVIVDLNRLDYVSSAGLRAFLQLKRDCARKDVPIVFAGSQGMVEKVIRVSGFENIFRQFPSVQDAMQAVAAAGA
jgi:anti-sigma B factor antagonist